MRITPIDDSLANDGTWVSYMGVELKIARANNESFRTIFRKLSKPYERDIENERLDSDTAENILCKSMAHAILLDWKASTFPDNIEYSKEAAEDLLRNDPDCRDFVSEFSRERENFYQADYEDRVGK